MDYPYPQAGNETVNRLWEIMQRHIGRDRRVQRETLTFAVFHKVSKSYDRKLRDAIATISVETTPIIWDDGYFIPENEEEAESYRASMRSRQKAISQRLMVLDRYLRQQAEPVQVEQMKLIEVG